MQLNRLIYVSRAVDGSDVDLWGLASILQAAERNNYQHGLTGALLAHDGYFCQALEGTPEAIQGLMDILHRDHRHADIRVLCNHPVRERAFRDWTMAQVIVTPDLATQLAGLDLSGMACDSALHILSGATTQLRVDS